MLLSGLTLLLSSLPLAHGSASQGAQAVLGGPAGHPDLSETGCHVVEEAILSALDTYPDPVDALVSLRPDLEASLSEPRLLHVLGKATAEWMAEGDKLRLRRQNKKFMDITEHQDFYEKQEAISIACKASKFHESESSSLYLSPAPPLPPCLLTLFGSVLPPLRHQGLVRPLFPRVSTEEMRKVLRLMTGYYI